MIMLRKIVNFVLALQVRIEGKILLSNFLFDSRQKRIPGNVIRDYWQGISEEWHNSDKKMIPEDFTRICTSSLDSKKLYFKGPTISTDITNCSRVIVAQDIITYKNVDLSKIGFNINGYISTKQIMELERLGLKGIARGHMSSSRPLAWVTKSSNINNLRKAISSRKQLANTIKSKLGLLHFVKDYEIIEVKYPRGILAKRIYSPTFIEGCPSLAYKSCTSRDNWGKTCDLNNYGDGLSEAVHPPMPFTDNYSIKYIGILRPSDRVFDWEKFFTTFRYKWSSRWMREFVKYA